MKDCSVTPEKMEKIYRAIGENVRRARAERGVSQLALSLAIGHKAVGTVSMCEIYHNKKHFNIEHLVKIADVLEIDVAELFKFE